MIYHSILYNNIISNIIMYTAYIYIYMFFEHIPDKPAFVCGPKSSVRPPAVLLASSPVSDVNMIIRPMIINMIVIGILII